METGKPVFVDVTMEAGLGDFKHETGGYGQSLMPEIVGGGGGFIDYNGDGWEDILLVAGGKWSHNELNDVQCLYLYHNNGDGTFTDVTEVVGLDLVRTYGFGVTVADYDNDGNDDFYLTTIYKNLLFKNDRGFFVDVSNEAGLNNESAWSTSALFFDADNDSWPDLYVGSYVDWTPASDLTCMYRGKKVFCTPQEYTGRSSYFYKNNGDGTFTEWTREAGFLAGVDTTLDKTLGVAVFDFNNDGWMDITTGNDTENDMLYVNQGDGTFKESGLQSGIAVSKNGYARAGMGLDTGVVDSTGNVSIFVGNFSDETVSVFRYMGNNQFFDRASASKVGFPSTTTLTFGLVLVDVDSDTDLDLLTANGHVLTHINEVSEAVTFKQPSQLYINRGNGVFDTYETDEGPLAKPLVARGLTYADYDKDGDVDLLYVENGGPAHLWRNDTDGGGYLRVQARGSESNKDALGTRIEAVANGLTMKRWVQTGASFLTSAEKTVTFGLGTNEVVDTLRVVWPTGKVDQFTDVAVNQEIRIVEGQGSYEPVTMD
ncbi:MAG: CRTAC1 family protein [Rhodothermaceae bacterium]|nr:CRTAC1 family protein [Rhodothermaceae bacterium]